MKRTRSKMNIRTMNRNVLKDPRHKDFNYNTILLLYLFLVSLMKQPFLGKLNIFSVQLTTKERATLKSWVDPKMIIQKHFSKHISVKMETMSSDLDVVLGFNLYLKLTFIFHF